MHFSFSLTLCRLILGQGYCEGVVGQFFGSDVHFHAKLKVPVKAKRASVASRKSPPPSDNASPIGQPSRPSSSSKTEAEAASSPRDLHFSIDVPQSKSMPPTRASSPPTLSVLHSQAAMIPTVHKQNTYILPLKLTTEATIPLRINKRPPQFSHNLGQSVSQPPSSSSVPESYSTHDERSKRQSVGMTDVQVGIGLSLLQDLANGMDSDSDNEDDQRPKPDQNSPAAGTPDFDSYAAAVNCVESLYEGTQESTVHELGYAQSEEDYGETKLAGRGKHTVIVEDTPSQTTSAGTIRTSIYSNSSGHNTSLPSSASPVSPSQSSFSTNERRPSLAPSAASTSEWEGASDIYDDYRYSRYSMTGKMSRFSSSAGWTGVSPTPPLPESNSIGRARTDSDKSKPDFCARSRTDSMNTRSNIDSSSISSEMNLAGGESLLSSLPLLPASEIGIQGSQHQDDLRRMVVQERPTSMESVASVYTQNSRLSTLSQDVIDAMSSGSNANSHFDTFPSSNTNGINPGNINARPAPLLLSQSDVANSPLLHTTWPTPLSSAFDGPSSARSDLRTPIVGGGVRSPLGFTDEEASKGVSDIMTTGSFSHGVNGGGIASAMRQRLETELRSPTPEQTQNQRLIRNTSQKSFIQSDGLGHRIVVEDEDELPSRILDNSTFTTMSPEPMYDEDEESDSNKGRRRSDGGHDKRPTSSPDLDLMMLKTHLAPLIVANRTPSPSFLVDGSDEIQGSGRADEVEDEEEEEDPEAASSTIIPTVPPLNASTSSLPQSSTSSSLALPRLSSASTIRTGSPTIDIRPPLALSDIREPRGPFVPGSNQRRSLFLPHPNAPKSPGDVSIPGLVGPGPGVPMYIAVQQGGWARGPGGMIPSSPNVIRVIMMALSTPPGGAIPQGQGPPGQRSPLMIRMRGPTIYGRTETDLTDSLVPVPIVFSIDPPHVTAPQPSSNPNSPSLAPPPQGTPTAQPSSSPITAPTPQASVPSSPTQVITRQQQLEPQQHPTGPGAGAAAVSASLSDVSPSAGEGDAAEPKATGGLIPRPKFSPKSSGLRPRSRSLSHFDSTDTGVPKQR